MLGRESAFAIECREEGFVGGDWDFSESIEQYLLRICKRLIKQLSLSFEKIIRNELILMLLHLAACYAICKSIQVGDIVLYLSVLGDFVGEVYLEHMSFSQFSMQVKSTSEQLRWLDHVD